MGCPGGVDFHERSEVPLAVAIGDFYLVMAKCHIVQAKVVDQPLENVSSVGCASKT